ncbi:hypothetical protein I532_03735 [Brevibacillus borstelensis AK1]|uniref:ParB/Sulfiredoxin domain-containing protein n=1 Tax=Brevibacillus borstelensis AK1 TaxID=1300222 RepID=M8EGV8_9BACL|nr:hypothetical protein [Brevibacillus borstelensis]EMT54685.1 hypothetical protein I532_03735 [Brevibacillus borstelensis AK1]
MILGWSLPKRKQLIDELCATRQDKKYPLKFQGRMEQFDVYTIPIEMPKYRLANGRTQAAQEEYISKHLELPEDYFEADLESEEVHSVQHDLLKKMLKSTNVDLISFFQTNIQEEPLILTRQGFVVNGNRRLCALRELYESDKDKYQRFKYIDVIILPPCSEDDINELEAQLQIKKDIKADYSWISTACMLRKKQNQLNISNTNLAKLYGMKDKDVEELLDELEHVDAYLKNRKKPKEYENVGKSKYAFEQLRKCRNKINNAAEKDIFTSITYCIIDSPAQGRLYETIPQVAEYLPKIIDRLAEELESEISAVSDQADRYDILGGDNDESTLENLAIVVSNFEHQEQILEVVRDVIDEEKEREKDRRNKNFVMGRVQKANTYLTEAVACFDNNSEVNGINEQLDAIEDAVRQLREMLRTYA